MIEDAKKISEGYRHRLLTQESKTIKLQHLSKCKQYGNVRNKGKLSSEKNNLKKLHLID
jgi:hypothetical protein